MAGRGRGFTLKKPINPPSSDDKLDDTPAAPSAFNLLVGRGRGIQLRSTLPRQAAPSSEIPSSASSIPLLGRGRGLFAAARGPAVPPSIVSSESDSIEPVKQFSKDQFADVEVPKQISDSSGRGRSSGRGSESSNVGGLSKFKPSARPIPKLPEPEIELVPEIQAEQEDEPEVEVMKHGIKGTPFTALTNCIMIKCDKDFGVFEYEVRFQPDIDYIQHRYKYLGQLREEIGNVRIFDGVTLYLPKMLDDRHMTYLTPALDGNGEVQVTIIFRRRKRIAECIHLYNVLFERIMRDLNYERVGRKCFDPSSPKIIKQHNLEVWPGYVKSVEEQEGGLMLLLDVSHRVLSQKTILEYMSDCAQRARHNFKDQIKKALIGHVVLTRYNNKTYRIDDIDFDKNPQSTFKKSDVDISYAQYYKQQYGLEVKDMRQPLLITRVDVRLPGQKEKVEQVSCFLPELCYLTGLTDEMRSQYTIMKDLAVYTKLAPHQRVTSYQKYIENINKNEKAKQKLLDWGLMLDSDPCKVTARILNKEIILFGQGKSFEIGPQADFSRNATSCQALEPTNLLNWVLVHVENDARVAESFEKNISQVSGPTGMRIAPPRRLQLKNDRTETYINEIKNILKDKNIQMIVTIFPTLRDDRYAAVKRLLCSDLPCPSQCINSKTLKNEAKNRSIVQKIILQMNCKLGGTLWGIKIPLKQTMIVGIDTYHEANQKGLSVSAFVASMNSSFTKWNSVPCVQKKKEELTNGLIASLGRSLLCYRKLNENLPDRIIFYRDGVGDGQLDHVSKFEIPQLKAVCEKFSPGYSPKMTFIVVQKRINHKFFKINNDKGGPESLVNPPPGTVLDKVVTRRNAYDFFLCSQHVREGTLTPSHYIVLQDDNQFEPDIIQQLTYKLTYLYFNWPGSVRVPAPVQYAHKLAHLIGLAVKANVDESLTDKLFFL